ncbi:uncharacterized protein B0T23DRAFT_406805 [Neurospora hispaniola]|uniref:Uncharacterized protein n=1 Tax=Neurospora hispaniola TaxID=588809 RepID=A0AAJ0I1A3_9PEZI|nr:hypothetical protein B0T23DRAFT_406805 [Neurospora hispaniola]
MRIPHCEEYACPGIKLGNRNLGPPNLPMYLQKMNTTVSMALEADNANFPTQTLVSTIVGGVFIGYLWFWHRSTKVWVRCNGTIDAFTNVPENTQRTRITTICLPSIYHISRNAQHPDPPPPYDSGGPNRTT